MAKLELFFGRDRDAWRLYVHGWAAPFIKAKLDANNEAFPVAEPDLVDLEKYMWGLDAPYVAKTTTAGGVMIEASNRSAIVIWEWLDGHLKATNLGR